MYTQFAFSFSFLHLFFCIFASIFEVHILTYLVAYPPLKCVCFVSEAFFFVRSNALGLIVCVLPLFPPCLKRGTTIIGATSQYGFCQTNRASVKAADISHWACLHLIIFNYFLGSLVHTCTRKHTPTLIQSQYIILCPFCGHKVPQLTAGAMATLLRYERAAQK